jgi:hypothetical protein
MNYFEDYLLPSVALGASAVRSSSSREEWWLVESDGTMTMTTMKMKTKMKKTKMMVMSWGRGGVEKARWKEGPRATHPSRKTKSRCPGRTDADKENTEKEAKKNPHTIEESGNKKNLKPF